MPYNKRPNPTHIRTRNICVRNSRAPVFESDVRNMRVRSSYTRTGYGGGKCKGFLIYWIKKYKNQLKAIKSFITQDFFLTLQTYIFLFPTLFCPAER